jgi:phosphoglycolate phosphatase
VRALYVDIDGTLVGPGGDLLWSNTTRTVDALLRCREAGVAVVPVSGRTRIQVRELCRLLGLSRGIAELGCVHVEGLEARYELGGFPFPGETPVEAMVSRGPLELVLGLGRLEPHEPWNEGREASYLLRGDVDVDKADATLRDHGMGWCQVVDNGVLQVRGGHAYHLAPAGTGKASGVRADRERHGLAAEECAYVGDAASDVGCAREVGEGWCWLVDNADPGLDWPLQTAGAYGDGVAEVVDRLLGA